ncbi:hypothetical protein IR083_21270 [Dysgonomonas sp. GY75]|uniref:hypothetical protein n=1 Tax=Dysgonomonas sp. GY75 TaxID=2780419 RepID=UPI0018847A9C|nr:hypothetical protein [Dysgonomonas sp. GY75]MBF0651350.1 hypothetical protein [Dysgonomonas sp. GY75]
MEMANYILSILRTNLNIVWSWGFNSPKPTQNGLSFKVQGFLHKGWVVVKYNEGTDLFGIKLLTDQLKEIKSIEGIYVNQLIDMIDDMVECCDNYDQKVKNEYSLE